MTSPPSTPVQTHGASPWFRSPGENLLNLWNRPDVRAGIRTGLALVLAYGISLRMDWDKPLWAGISVLVLAVAPVGTALQKAWFRLLGSLVGAAIAFLIVAMFPQERWLFLISVALWVGICTFSMRRSAHPYAWNVAGFVAPIIAIGSGPPDGVAFFFTAIERLQETICGILAYTLFAILIKDPPVNRQVGITTWEDCKQAILLLADDLSIGLRPQGTAVSTIHVQHRNAASAAIKSVDLSSRSVILTRARLLKIVDSLHRSWHCLSQSPQPVQAILQPRWSESREKLSAFLADNSNVARPGATVSLGSLRDHALVMLNQWFLNRLDVLTEPVSSKLPPDSHVDDHSDLWSEHHLQEDIVAALQVVLSLLFGALLWIYLPDVPTGPTVIVLMAPIAMIFATSFGAPAYKLLAYVMQGILIGVGLQVFVLTQISGFLALAALLFIIGAGITVWKYKDGLARTLIPVVVISILGITNLQTFSFVAALNNALLWIIIALVISVAGELPFSSSSDAVFLRLYKRFRRLIHRIIEGAPMAWGYRSAISTPSELRPLLGKIISKQLPANAKQLDDLVTCCEDSQFWLTTWWSLKTRTQSDGAAPFGLSTTLIPTSLTSGYIAGIQQAIDVLQSYLAEQSSQVILQEGAPTPPETQHHVVYLGCCWQLLGSLQRLTVLDASIAWSQWPKPPLPWSSL